METRQADEEERQNLPYFFVVQDSQDHEDVVRPEDNFASIGSGSYVAIPALHQREQEDSNSLLETIYNVYEAKRLSQIVPGVGLATSIDVLYPDGTTWEWSDELADRCKWLFDRLGPKLRLSEKKAKDYFGEFKDSYLEPLDEDEKTKPKRRDTKL